MQYCLRFLSLTELSDMAAHVENILDIILSLDFHDIASPCGKPVGPSSKIYVQISDILKQNPDSTKHLKPKYIYVLLQKNRYGIWDKVLKFFNFEIGSSIIESDEDITLNESNSDLITFNLNLSYKLWLKIAPEEVFYADSVLKERRYNVLLRKVWTDELYAEIYAVTKLPCPLIFKRCKISGTGIFLTVSGRCPECDCIFKGCVINKPLMQTDVTMECVIENFDDSITHKRKRQLKGKRRIKVSKEMVDANILPCIWRRKEADRLMSFGDNEPAHLPNVSVLRKAKEQRHNADLGISVNDPIESIKRMKYDFHAGHIHSIGLDPFFVHYWTQEQMAIYLQYSNFICVDATGSLVKKLKLPTNELSSHIYLYQIMIETSVSKMPVFQMLSTIQNTNAIMYWFNEIIRIGCTHKQNFPYPNQIVCDFDKALMGAVARSFGRCKSLKDYLQQCFCYLTEIPYSLPSCLIRLDISHYVHLISQWNEFKNVHPRVKTFYMLIMGYLTKITDFRELENVIRSVIILCNSEGCGLNQNKSESVAEQALKYLHGIIKGNTDISNIVENENTVKDISAAEALFFNDDKDIQSFEKNTIGNWLDVLFQDCINVTSAPQGEAINSYYAPAITSKIKSILHYFPLYTNTMTNAFKLEKIHVSSSAVESEFNDLKHRILRNECRPMRIDKFLSVHLKSFSGKAKLAVAKKEVDLNLNKEQVICKIRQNKENARETNIDNKESSFEIENFDLNKNETTSDENKENTYDIKSISNLETPNSSFDESCDLLLEQNWRNKNAPKKIKRTYLSARPNWNITELNKKNVVGIGMLKNGNLCPSIAEKKIKYVVQNTCGIDSIFHILAFASIHNSFRQVIESSSTKAFEFLKLFLKTGSSKLTYKKRAELLREIKCFVSENVPGVIVINAVSSISYLCVQLFKEDFSYYLNKTCIKCTNVVERKGTILPINIDILKQFGHEKLQNAIDEHTQTLNKNCKKCNSNVNINIEYGNIIFIETTDGTDHKTKLHNFTNNLILNGARYELAGVIDYRGGTTITSVGHYTAFVKNNEWMQFDDFNKKPVHVMDDTEIKPEICIYVKT